MIEYKSQFIKDNGYGGGMIWALDLDDFKGEFCGCGKYPLLTAINRVLRNYNNGASVQCNPGYQSTQAVFYNAFLPQYQLQSSGSSSLHLPLAIWQVILPTDSQ